MQQKQSSAKDFQMLSKLGEGAFGVVWKVRRKEDGIEYAMKKVKLGAMKEKQRQNAVNEIRILASLNDEYIIGYKDAFYDESTSTLNVVMEYASAGDVLKKVNDNIKKRTKMPEEEIWKALVHMTKGLKSLHDIKILHRDLKCANVFIDNQGVYKLGDLNVSKVLKQGLAHTQTGTPYYASPEIWQDLPYDSKSDMWSLGCVLYEMAALKPPFNATDLQGLFRKVKAGVFQRIPSVYSNDLAIIISMLLKVSPAMRPTTDQLLANSIVLKHFKGDISAGDDDKSSELLQTIKFNPKNLVALKSKLPKANYIKEEIEQEPKVEPKKEEVKVQAKVQPKVEAKVQQKKEQPPRNLPRNESRSELEKRNKERVLSACGIRQAAYCESPRIVTHKQDEVKRTEDPYKKYRMFYPRMLDMNNPKLPPKPQQQQQQPQMYKLPPKPQPGQYNPQSNRPPSSHNNNVNRSYDDVRRSQSREKLQPLPIPPQTPQSNRPSSQAGGYLAAGNSRDNLQKNAPQGSSRGSQQQRPTSASRAQVQPSWWG